MSWEAAELRAKDGWLYGVKFYHETLAGIQFTKVGLRIDTGRARLDVRVSNRELAKTITFQEQFNNVPVITLGKTSFASGLSTAEQRNGTAYFTAASVSGFTLSYQYNAANFIAGDYIDIFWTATEQWI